MRSIALLALLVVTLGVVAVLQYRWIDAASAADAERAHASLDAAAQHFGEEVDRELGRTLAIFRRATGEPDDLARQYEEWTAIARDRRLIKTIWMVEVPHDEPQRLLRFDPATQSFTQIDRWPAELLPARDYLPGGSRHQRGQRRPVIAELPALVTPARLPGMGGEGDGPPPPPREEGFFRPPPFEGGEPRPRRPRPPAIMLQLDRAYLARDFFPELARRYFDDEYDVAVTDGQSIVYRSSASWPTSAAEIRADASLPLMRIANREDTELPPSPWQLVAKRRGASLDTAVRDARRRNFAVSFAILALLGSSAVLLAVVARRAERLRLQQLEFVAGITHELNTPIAAITSAGQNLADGVVTEPSQMKRYGAMVVKEARRLSETVGQVLHFGGLQVRGAQPRLARADVAAIVDEAVAHAHWLAEERGVVLEVDVARDLPPIGADVAALAGAIQNLIVNAIRHGGEGGWVGVKATASRGYVCVTVEDRGPGIAARDIPHLFEPFYRGRDSVRVRGSGLGLTIVSQVAKAHGGSVEIERRRARGAAFTLKLPALTPAAAAAMESQHA